jgi:predicted glycosyltransferase involved in capsule biosynthesis
VLYDLDDFRRPGRKYAVTDITVVIAVRLHSRNGWVAERIAALAGYYQPRPHLLIVDFGSDESHREQVAEACRSAGVELLRVEDDGVFCLAKARNCGASHARSELLFFSDIDCFGESDLFARLVAHANALEMSAVFDHVVNLPVHHLGPLPTAEFFAATTTEARSAALSRAMTRSVFAAPVERAEYVDPHSNFFLIRRDFFDYLGGVNETFRGHGSEDFEFLLRLSLYSQQYPMPDRPADDLSLSQASAGTRQPYRGFRRLFELMAYPSLAAGLRIAHMHHERDKDATGWHENKDWSRTRFSEQVMPFLESRRRLLDYDWMPRSRRALVLIHQEAHADVFFPLRLAGYRLTTAISGDEASLQRGLLLIERREVDAVAVFNPYMSSHRDLKPLFGAALQQGVRTIVFERGALPESWYYGPDMSYADPDYAALELDADAFSEQELALTDAYIARLRAGEATLESNGSYAATAERFRELRAKHERVCLVPLQLPDDVAVTRFNEGYPPYPDFLRELPAAMAARADVLFLVKSHPLSARPFEGASANVIVCGPDDNIHALIDCADAVVAYNSGVGLLALVHGKRLITLGNAFYNRPGLGKRARSAAEAIELALGDAAGFHDAPVRLLVAWLVLRKYSFFRSESVLRKLTDRKSHGYRNMLWYRLNLDGTHVARRAGLEARVHPRSHAAVRLGIADELEERARSRRAEEPSTRASSMRRATPSAKLDKLLRDPKRFLADSRSRTLRALGEALPETTLERLARGISRVRSRRRG